MFQKTLILGLLAIVSVSLAHETQISPAGNPTRAAKRAAKEVQSSCRLKGSLYYIGDLPVPEGVALSGRSGCTPPIDDVPVKKAYERLKQTSDRWLYLDVDLEFTQSAYCVEFTFSTEAEEACKKMPSFYPDQIWGCTQDSGSMVAEALCLKLGTQYSEMKTCSDNWIGEVGEVICLLENGNAGSLLDDPRELKKFNGNYLKMVESLVETHLGLEISYDEDIPSFVFPWELE